MSEERKRKPLARHFEPLTPPDRASAIIARNDAMRSFSRHTRRPTKAGRVEQVIRRGTAIVHRRRQEHAPPKSPLMQGRSAASVTAAHRAATKYLDTRVLKGVGRSLLRILKRRGR